MFWPLSNPDFEGPSTSAARQDGVHVVNLRIDSCSPVVISSQHRSCRSWPTATVIGFCRFGDLVKQDKYDQDAQAFKITVRPNLIVYHNSADTISQARARKVTTTIPRRQALI